MKRNSTKKSMERRKTPRKKTTLTDHPSSLVNQERCMACSQAIAKEDKVLFVEEEVGRVFCSESCIADYFVPEIEKLEKDYFNKLSPKDFSSEERENLSHLRYITLQEPDEVWREKTVAGDYRFTLISEFKPSNKSFWCVCICLCLRGEPSFLYLAFPTKNAAMLNSYRRGERVEWVREGEGNPDHSDESVPEGVRSDGLADAWTEEETIRAQMTQDRDSGDILPSEFHHYQKNLEVTIQNPDEVWSLSFEPTQVTPRSSKLYHFIKSFHEPEQSLWYVIVAREVGEEDQIEILDAFPTRDPSYVDHFRQGIQEVGKADPSRSSRNVH